MRGLDCMLNSALHVVSIRALLRQCVFKPPSLAIPKQHTAQTLHGSAQELPYENVRQFLSVAWPFIFLESETLITADSHAGREQRAVAPRSVLTEQTFHDPEREECDSWAMQSSPTSGAGHLSAAGLLSLGA